MIHPAAWCDSRMASLRLMTSVGWTLDALAEAAVARGIVVKRSQVRRIFLAAGARWRKTCS